MRRALLVAVVLLLAGCGGGAAKTAGPPGTPATDAQLLVLAQLLLKNHDAGGARLQGQIPVRGKRVAVSGRVDFVTGRGALAAQQAGSPSRRYVWTRTRVYAQRAPGARRYDAERPQPRTNEVHSAIRFINLLSAETIDNTTNLRDQGVRFLRRDRLDDTPVDVYALGATTYWVRADGTLMQVRASLPGGPIQLRLSAPGRQKVSLPVS